MAGSSWILVDDDADHIRTIRLRRPPVNALCVEVLEQLDAALSAAINEECRALVLTGDGSFFSFGFDVPRLLQLGIPELRAFLGGFCAVFQRLFVLPCPLVTAMNGHAIAGGCILGLTGDERIMVEGRARISLNEITFGSTIFGGVVEMLRFYTSGAVATQVLYGGEMYGASEAKDAGLIDYAVAPDRLVEAAASRALEISRNRAAFLSLKGRLRAEVGQRMLEIEQDSLEEFLGIWTSHSTQAQLQGIAIR